jgi:hypothetical protein
MMPEIKSENRQKDKYTIKIVWLPDDHVQSITILKHEMDSDELGELIKGLDKEYQPMKIVIVDI